MMYHVIGIFVSAKLLRLCSLLVKNSNKLIPDCNPILYIPLGWLNPNLVPCPPLINNTPTALKLVLTLTISNSIQSYLFQLLLVLLNLF